MFNKVTIERKQASFKAEDYDLTENKTKQNKTKHSTDSFNIRGDQAEKRIGELKIRSFEDPLVRGTKRKSNEEE